MHKGVLLQLFLLVFALGTGEWRELTGSFEAISGHTTVEYEGYLYSYGGILEDDGAPVALSDNFVRFSHNGAAATFEAVSLASALTGTWNDGTDYLYLSQPDSSLTAASSGETWAVASGTEGPTGTLSVEFDNSGSPCAGTVTEDRKTISWDCGLDDWSRGSPGARMDHLSAVEGDKMLVWGGYTGTYMNDLWVFSFTAATWTLVAQTGSIPSARYASAWSRVSTPYNALVMFAGTDSYGNSLNDMYRLNRESLRLLFSPSPASTYAWTQITSTGSTPAARGDHSLSLTTYGTPCIVLFGGRVVKTSTLLNDVWTYCPADTTPQWTEISPSGTLPNPRYGHGVVLRSNRLVIVGGYSGQYPDLYLSQVVELDPIVWKWRYPSIDNGPLTARTKHTANMLDSWAVFIGGRGSGTARKDVWITDYAAVQCTQGSYSPDGEGDCLPCPAGQYTDQDGLYSCLTCLEGTYAEGTGNSGCEECPIGTYGLLTMATSQGDCTFCDAGTYRGETGATSAAQCLPCEAGTWSDQGFPECLNCAAGTFSPAQSSGCFICLAGSYAPEGSGSCPPCNAGDYGPDDEMEACYACPSGYYSDSGATSCEKCPAGTYNKTPKGATISACTDCSPGTYQPAEGQQSCIACPDGRFAASPGAASEAACLPCPEGEYQPVPGAACEACPAGSFNPITEQTSCTLCSPGTYNPDLGAVSNSSCLACPSGQITSFSGANSVEDCEGCSTGSFRHSASLQCVPCPAGTYSSDSSANDISTCHPCNAMEYSLDGAATCEACPAGTVSFHGWSHCSPCSNSSSCPVAANGIACAGYGSCAGGACLCHDGWSGVDCSQGTCEGCPGFVEFSAPVYLMSEGRPDTFDLTLRRSCGSDGIATVVVNVVSEGARTTMTPNSDYTANTAALPKTALFLDGETESTVTLPILDDATRDEPCENLQLVLTDPFGVSLGILDKATVMLEDNDFSSEVLDTQDSSEGAGLGPTTASVFLGLDAVTVDFTVNVPENMDGTPLDLVLLQDLSGSFDDDIVMLKRVVPDLLARLQELFPDPRFGVAAFVDKPCGGSGITGDFVYETFLPLTSDAALVSSTIDELTIYNGQDTKECQLEAILHCALREEEIGWRENARRVIVLTTDADYHDHESPGDDEMFFGLPDNNLDDVLDGNGCGEKYPSAENIRDILRSKAILPIFAVTQGTSAVYLTLANIIGMGAVVTLSDTSSNLVSAVVSGLEKITREVLLNVVADPHGLSPTVNPAKYTDVSTGASPTFQLTFQPCTGSCPSAPIAVEVESPGYGTATVDIVVSKVTCDVATELAAQRVDAAANGEDILLDAGVLDAAAASSGVLGWSGWLHNEREEAALLTYLNETDGGYELPMWTLSENVTVSDWLTDCMCVGTRPCRQNGEAGICGTYSVPLIKQCPVDSVDCGAEAFSSPLDTSRVMRYSPGEDTAVQPEMILLATYTTPLLVRNPLPYIIRAYSRLLPTGGDLDGVASGAVVTVSVVKYGGAEQEVMQVAFPPANNEEWEFQYDSYVPINDDDEAPSVATVSVFGQSGVPLELAGMGLMVDPDSSCRCEAPYFADRRYPVARRCQYCHAGYYCLSGARFLCEEGYMSFGGATECRDCPPGWRCINGYGSPCGDGTYLTEEGECEECPDGYRCLNGHRTACPPGTFGRGFTECILCEPGTVNTEAASTDCGACPAGETSNYRRTACVPCPAGEFSVEGQHPCSPCEEGTYSEGAVGECTPCAQGSYSVGTSSRTCLPCPPGFTTSGDRGTSVADCNVETR